MKTFRIASTVVFVLVALLSLGAMTAAAGGQPGDSPDTAPYIDNQLHTIQPHAGMWFRFDYDAVDRAITTITLVDGNKSGMRFEVWTPEGVTNTGDNKPVGRGTANKVNCGTGEQSNQGGCETSDLTWVGAFRTGGTYFVQIVNDNDTATNALLTIKGAGVSLGAPTAPAPSTAAQPTPPAPPAPTSPSAIEQNIDDPNKAVAIDNSQHNIAAHSATWFRFNYGGTELDPRPVKTVTLVNAKDSGVRFEVWTPDHVNDWWDNQKPIGRGTLYMLDCATGQPSQSGQCQSNDLTWMGAFNIGGTYYVRVVNDNDQPMTFTLTIN